MMNLLLKVMTGLTVATLLVSCSNNKINVSAQDITEQLDSLVDKQQFFNLQSTFEINQQKLTKEEQLYYQAILHNVFNQAALSNEVIIHLLSISTQLNDSKINKIYQTKLLNHINLYQYFEAAQCSEYILKNFRTYNTEVELQALENEINIWQALANTPPQEMIISSDTTIPMFRDKADLLNVDVQFTNSKKSFIFDTGANFSVVTQSVADQLNLLQIPADFYITAATGNQVKSGLAVAQQLSLQGIQFNNVVFLVLADQDLSFPQIEYFPNGALGFPLIEALNEIRINKNDSIFVPRRPIEYPHHNFALDGLMPIAAVQYNGDLLSFTFDTGARKTTLYPQFYLDYQQEIETTYQKSTFQSSGAGGTINYEGYLIDSFEIGIADSIYELSNTRVHINDLGGKKSNFHGNLGQDFIKNFDQMIISFKHASVLFQ